MSTAELGASPAARSGTEQPRHIGLFVRSFSGGGGAERVMLNLAGTLASQGHRIDLLMGRQEGHFLDALPATVNVINLNVRLAWQIVPTLLRFPHHASLLLPTLLSPRAPWVLGAAPGIAKYLQTERPDALLSALSYANIATLFARHLVNTSTRIAISIHNHLSVSVAHTRKLHERALPRLARHFYTQADSIIAVSNGVADDLAHVTALPRSKITTIYNPIFSPDIAKQAQRPVDHAWFTPHAPPVVLGIGKLKPQKDFRCLIRAFARVRAVRPARLIILGDGDQRKSLLALARHLHVSPDVELPGFVANPFAYLGRAGVFVLSSAWEGLSNVIVEALACGCPVVSTDCPSGPAELLDHGRYGGLVPVGDDEALAHKILATLDSPPDRQPLQTRASEFSIQRAVAEYSRVLLGA